MEIQEKKPDIDYNRRKSSIRPEVIPYHRTQYNIQGNSDVITKSPQRLFRLGDKNNYPTLSTHNLSEQVQDLNSDDQTNSYNLSSNFPSFIPKTNNNNEQSIVNSNIRRLSMINNNTLYKMPTGKKDTENVENKKLVFQKVMKISSFNDYKDDIEQIEKAIKLSSNMNLNQNSNSNTVNNTNATNNFDLTTNNDAVVDNNDLSNDLRKYKIKQTSPLKNEIKKVTISEEIEEINDVDNNNIQHHNNDTITENNNNDTVTNNNNNNNNNIVADNTLSVDNNPNENQDINNKVNDNAESLSNNMVVNDEDFTKTNDHPNMQDSNEINEIANESLIEENIINHNIDAINDSEVPVNEEEKNIPYNTKNEDHQYTNDNSNENNDDSNNVNSNSPIDDIDEKTKQEQRDILLANELEDEKKLDYHPFMSSTQKLSSEQKVDEIVVSEDSHKEINDEDKNN